MSWIWFPSFSINGWFVNTSVNARWVWMHALTPDCGEPSPNLNFFLPKKKKERFLLVKNFSDFSYQVLVMVVIWCEGYGCFMCPLYCGIMEPLLHGDYPISLKKNVGARIPTFTNRESKLVKGSYDFIGVIHYTNVIVTYNP